jgi:hypothetical protein
VETVMRISVAFRQVMVAAAVLVPTVAFAQFGAPTSPSPGPSFVWVGQWVPCSHPIAIQAGLGCVNDTPAPIPPAVDDDEPPPPPTADVWGETDAYSGVSTRVTVLLQTADPNRWFCKGCRYIAPYGDFRMTVLDRVKLANGNWAWIGQITKSGGAPPVGTILSYPYYGDRGLWMTEAEFAAAVGANSATR